jgi:endo-1,4-beta-D-glucanase Y
VPNASAVAGNAGSAASAADAGGASAGGASAGAASAGAPGLGGTGSPTAGSGAMAGSSAMAGADGIAGSAGSAGGPVSTPPKGLGACTMPAGANFADAQASYPKWKADLLTADGAGGFLRVKRPNSGSEVNSSNSEGTAYGMAIAVYMDDQATFDKLWQYEQIHRGANGLMDWEISATGGVLGSGAATDGDEDMAFALLMADKKWGGQGSLSDSYLSQAKKLIDLIWQHEVDHARSDVLMPGDQFADGQIINISYFAPAYYRLFGQATGKTDDWNRTVKASYDALEAALNATNKNATNGLVPAWSTPAGVPTAPAGSGHPTYHQLDSCRTPFRIAQDYCWFGEPRALTYLQKISAFYEGVGALNLVDAYNLDGTPYPGASLHLAAFVGGAGVGAMATKEHAKLRDDAYAGIAAWQSLLGGSLYYNESWSMLSLLMMSGHFLDLSAN